MRKIDLGQMITIAANVGVIAGIVFLAMELRQNTAAVQGATYQALSDGNSNQYLGVVHDPAFAAALQGVYAGQEMAEFSETEAMQLIFYCNALIQRLENSYFQWQTGFVDDRIFQSYGWSDGILTSRFFSEYWSRVGARRNTDAQFRQFFEEHVKLWSADKSE
jgi:hypothetical protein